ncbi:unnamed protein product [Leptidea sinapis]|uniref:Uncharacterized protein n=1 Tax=Leptidea sinapis TaxID=189913 RepID=A0A5E4QLI3_9NEOP|nr:unnamed protein product [Leptidea sinapis]
MEEAEALGDRVAALHAGELRCSGYRLSLITNGIPNEAAISAVVHSVVGDATVKEASLNSISYSLPAKHSDKFPKLFALIESQREQLGIDSIGVGKSTLEEPSRRAEV